MCFGGASPPLSGSSASLLPPAWRLRALAPLPSASAVELPSHLLGPWRLPAGPIPPPRPPGGASRCGGGGLPNSPGRFSDHRQGFHGASTPRLSSGRRAPGEWARFPQFPDDLGDARPDGRGAAATGQQGTGHRTTAIALRRSPGSRCRQSPRRYPLAPAAANRRAAGSNWGAIEERGWANRNSLGRRPGIRERPGLTRF